MDDDVSAQKFQEDAVWRRWWYGFYQFGRNKIKNFYVNEEMNLKALLSVMVTVLDFQERLL